jgi:hypothetical protein
MACSKSLRLLERLPRRGGLEQLLAAARRPTGGLSKSRSTQLANKKSLAGSIQVGGLLRIHCAANGCAAAQFHVRREWARFGAAVQRCFGVLPPVQHLPRPPSGAGFGGFNSQGMPPSVRKSHFSRPPLHCRPEIPLSHSSWNVVGQIASSNALAACTPLH